MANEELSGIIQQLADIGTLIKQFSEIATEMNNVVKGATSELKNGKTNIEKSVKQLTDTAGKWDSKLSSVSQDVLQTNTNILSLTSSVSNVRNLLDERVQPIKDFSDVCTSISERLDNIYKKLEKMTHDAESERAESEVLDRIEKIETAIDNLNQNDELILDVLSSMTKTETKVGKVK